MYSLYEGMNHMVMQTSLQYSHSFRLAIMYVQPLGDAVFLFGVSSFKYMLSLRYGILFTSGMLDSERVFFLLLTFTETTIFMAIF